MVHSLFMTVMDEPSRRGSGGVSRVPPPSGQPPSSSASTDGAGGGASEDDEAQRSLLISTLVRQVKERKMSKGELFQSLSTLQQHGRRPSAAGQGDLPTPLSQRPETESTAGYGSQGHSREPSMSPAQGGHGTRERVSGFSDPDRRAFIQRLLEEKRRGQGNTANGPEVSR